MSSVLWRDPSTVCRIRASRTSWTPRPTVVVLGELLCLAGFFMFFGAPAKAAIGAGALGQRTQASQVAPIEKILSTNSQKKYRWYANGWNGPGYYEAGDAWKTGVGWGGSGWTGAGSPAIGSNIGASFGPGTFGAGSNGPSSGNFHSPGVQSSGSSPGNSGGINEEFRRINGPGNNQPRIMSGGFHFRR